MKKFLFIFLFVFSVFAGTKYIRYVNTGSSSGGDGTENVTTGSTRAYVSLSAWESSEQTNLTTNTDTMVVYCDGSGGADGTRVVIDGWTTAASAYIHILTTAANRHDGKWNTNKYHLSASVGYDGMIEIQEDYVRIEGIQIENTASSAQPQGIMYWGSGEVRILNNIIRATNDVVDNDCIGIGIYGSTNAIIVNNIVDNFYRNIISGMASGGEIIVYNNTCVNGGQFNCAFTFYNTCDFRFKNNLMQGGSTVISATTLHQIIHGRMLRNIDAAKSTGICFSVGRNLTSRRKVYKIQ